LAGNYDNSGNLELDFNYDFDFWGRNRSALQSTLGLRAASEAEAAGAAATLSAAVAKSYYQWQALNAHIALIEQIESERGELIKLEVKRVKSGGTAGDNLHPLVADAAAPRQTIIQLQTQRDQALYQLKSLVGGDTQMPELKPVELPKVDGGIPDNVALDLIARRPDVAAARDRVQAYVSNIDVARAEFYPDISISAFLGLNSVQMSKFLHASSRADGVTPAIHLPIFDAGRLRANLESSRADLALAIAQYDQTVQAAVADVNDAAIRVNGSEAEQPALAKQQEARHRDLDSAQRRVKAGLADKREPLRNQLSLLSLDDQELNRRTQALYAQIDLIKALGGGYGATDALAQK
jgi:multidrug efflux system outer membrane protein